MENDARLLIDLIYFNYEHLNGNAINIDHIYDTLHDTVNYSKEVKTNIKEYAFIYLRADYGLELNK